MLHIYGNLQKSPEHPSEGAASMWKLSSQVWKSRMKGRKKKKNQTNMQKLFLVFPQVHHTGEGIK